MARVVRTRRQDFVTRASAPRLVRSLRHRNFRLFFGGQTISLVGTWMTRIATGWLVYRLTGSALELGIIGFCGQIPALLLGPFAGVIIDRVDRRRLLVATQVLLLVHAAVLAGLTLANIITVPQLLVLQLMQGAINAFDMPARQSFVVEMVDDPDDLSNAIALNSTMINGSRVIGPSVGGALIAMVGEGWCFAIDALSYVAVIASLMAMTTPRSRPAPRGTRVLQELRSGWRYVMSSRSIRTTLALVVITSTMGMPYTVLMPAVAADALGGGPNTLGALMAAVGVGALAGGLYLASRESVAGLDRVILVGAVLFGGSLVAFSLSRVLWLALLTVGVTGTGFIIQLASTNTLLQATVDERFRGRVMSFYTTAILGTVPIGSLLAGVAADRIGAPATTMIGGIACMLGGVWFASVLGRGDGVQGPGDAGQVGRVPDPDIV